LERSVEEYSLDEPIGPSRGEAVGHMHSAGTARPEAFSREDLQGICANPLREEPHPVTVATVKRFGLVGLVGCAIGAAFLRWWRSPPSR